MRRGTARIHSSGISGRLVEVMSEPTSLGINCDENPCIMISQKWGWIDVTHFCATPPFHLFEAIH